MNRQQEEILDATAAEFGLTQGQAEEIFRLLCNRISVEISSDHKTDGLFDNAKFKVLHIDNFGKFIPNQRKIRHANFCLTKKLKPEQ
jgi:nucleoid DNA-binding protein